MNLSLICLLLELKPAWVCVWSYRNSYQSDKVQNISWNWCLSDRALLIQWRKQPTWCNNFFVLPTGASGTCRQQCRCIIPKAVYTIKKCSWGWTNLSSETCRADLKKINEKVNKRKSCCILLVAYIIVKYEYIVSAYHYISHFFCFHEGNCGSDSE